MGLLDDAIREHLELKRLKGAASGDVERAEREALGQERHEREGATLPGQSVAADVGRAPVDGDVGDALPAVDKPSAHTSASEETIELDMESMLASSQTGEHPEQADAPTIGMDSAPDADDSLEWEMPGDSELDRGDAADADDGTDEGQVEDVLEETPDFLRETPEQERLWFEQRPPRDFDFDE